MKTTIGIITENEIREIFLQNTYNEIKDKIDTSIFPLSDATLENKESIHMNFSTQSIIIEKDIFGGIDEKNGGFYLSINQLNELYFNRYFEGKHHTVLLFPYTKERESFFESFYPDWYSNENRKGRFVNNSNVYQDLESLRGAYNLIINAAFDEFTYDVEPISKSKNTIIWSDGVVTLKHAFTIKQNLPSINPILEKILNSNHKDIETEKLLSYSNYSSAIIEEFNNKINLSYSIEEIVCDNDSYYLAHLVYYSYDDAIESLFLLNNLKDAKELIKRR